MYAWEWKGMANMHGSCARYLLHLRQGTADRGALQASSHTLVVAVPAPFLPLLLFESWSVAVQSRFAHAPGSTGG